MKTYGILDQFLDELRAGFTLLIDNDCCYTRHDEDLGNSYDWGPKELAEIFAEELGFNTENV